MSDKKNQGSPTDGLEYWDDKVLCESCRALVQKSTVAKCPNCNSAICPNCQRYETTNCDRCK